MKNIIKILGIIAFIAIIGFEVTACKLDDESRDDNSTDGRLYVGNLSSYIGKSIKVSTNTWGKNGGLFVITTIRMDPYSAYEPQIISSDYVTFYVWRMDSHNNYHKSYTGDETIQVYISIGYFEYSGEFSVKLTNGIGYVEFQAGHQL